MFYAAGREDAAQAGFSDAFLYDELCRPPEARRIPMAQILRAEAQDPFHAWTTAPGRKEY